MAVVRGLSYLTMLGMEHGIVPQKGMPNKHKRGEKNSSILEGKPP